MNVFLLATKNRLRFQLNGNLSVEELWTVNYDLLAQYEEQLQAELETFATTTRRKSANKTAAQKLVELRLAVVTEVLNTRDEEMAAAQTAAANKEHNQRILALIQEKRAKELADLPIEKLEELLK